MKRRVLPPLGGASDNSTYLDQPERFAPLPSMLNVRPEESGGRRRIGQRPGLAKLFGTQLGGEVRAMAVISRAAAVSGYQLGSCEHFAGASRQSGALAGNHWLLDPEPGLNLDLDLDDSPFGGGGANGCVACDWHPDGTKFAVASNFIDGVTGRAEALVRMVDVDGNTLWTANLEDSTRDRFIDTIAVTHEWVFAASNEFIMVWQVSDGAPVGQIQITWARHIIRVAKNRDATMLLAAFDGSTSGATLPNGPTVEAGICAVHFRAGFMMFQVRSLAQGIIAQVPFGPALPSSATYYEADHGYWRISEHTRFAPRGAQITDACFGPSGEVILLTTNQGIGPNVSFPPDGSSGYITVRKIGPNGILAWEQDTASIRRSFVFNAITYFCDITEGTSDEPSVQAVCVDAEGRIYVGGRQNPGGRSVFCLHPTDGSIQWARNLVNSGGTIRQAAAAIDPSDNNPWFAFDRNSSWDGAAGREAMLIQLNRANGAVLKHFDLGASVSGLGVAVHPNRSIVLVTDRV